jgi:hypothetical protein
VLRKTIRAPFDITREIIRATLCGDYEALGYAIVNYGAFAVGGSMAWSHGVDTAFDHLHGKSRYDYDNDSGYEGGSCGANSFSADTLVWTEDGKRPIAEIKVGDMVLAYDEATGETGYFTVTDVLVHYDPGTILLTIDGETIETTGEHPFFTWQRGWVNAGDLQPGDWIYNTDQSYGVVESVVVEAEPQVMYNLTVDVAHTFFVGDEGWLVHNQNGPNTTVCGINNPNTKRSANFGNEVHYDQLNGGRGIGGSGVGGPTSLEQMYPNTQFQHTRRGATGPDVEVIGGDAPWDTSVYPNSTWAPNAKYADFKPKTKGGKRTFNSDIKKGKLPVGTQPIPYDSNTGALDPQHQF